MSVGTVLTLGFGSFGTVNHLPTLGYGDYGSTPTPDADPTTTGAAWSRGKKLRKGGLRWADFSTKEERQLALAQALAVEAVPIGDPDDEIIEAEDRLLIALVLSKVIH